jgi:hypothetical protein
MSRSGYWIWIKIGFLKGDSAMHTMQAIRKNRGMASAVVLLFTVTLGLMAMAGAVLIQREGNSIGRTVLNMQGDYAAHAGLKYAMERFKDGEFSEYEELDEMGDLTVSIDTLRITGDANGCPLKMRVTATNGDITYLIDGYLLLGNVEKAGVVHGSVTDVWVYRESGTKDATYLMSGADVPTIDEDNLISISNAQSHSHDPAHLPSDWTATSYGSFWYATGIPNVTYVFNNMTVPTGVTAYGLFLVGGNVTIQGSGSVEGVILQPNATSQVLLTSSNGVVQGGVISEGSLDGVKVTFLGFELAASKIRERHTYMVEANAFLIHEPRLDRIVLNPDE